MSGYRPADTVSGSIVYVGDGDSLCVGRSADPATWVEIRLADFHAPELHAPGGKTAKVALDRFKHSPAVCVAELGRNGSTVSYDRLIAVFRVDGRSLAEALQRSGVRQGVNGW